MIDQLQQYSDVLDTFQMNGIKVGYIRMVNNPTCVNDFLKSSHSLAELNQECNDLGFAINLSIIIFDILHIPWDKVQFVPILGNNYGSEVNGTWTGLIGRLSKGDVDISLGVMSTTPERLRVIDFSDFISTVAFGFLSR